MGRRLIERQNELSPLLDKQHQLKFQANRQTIDVNKVVHQTKVSIGRLEEEENRRFGQWRHGMDMKIEEQHRAQRKAMKD